MGVAGLWKELCDAGFDIPLNLLALQAFNSKQVNPDSSSRHPTRALVVGIDVSIWFFQAAHTGKQVLIFNKQAGKSSTSDLTHLPLKILFYRLGLLLALPIHPLFVCDGPGRPLHKRGKNIVTNGFSALQRDFLKLVDSFGFRYRVAPGEAEAELAYLSQIGLVDVVLSDDVDTLVFGARRQILNWSKDTGANQARMRRRRKDNDSDFSNSESEAQEETKEQEVKTMRKQDEKRRKEAWVTVYDAEAIQEDASIYLDKDGLVLIALLTKGDYNPDGLKGCGMKTAIPLAQAGFGKKLIEGYKEFCQRIPPPTFGLVSSDGNIIKSSRPTSSLKHLFKAYPAKPPGTTTPEWKKFLANWISELQHELATDSLGFFEGRGTTKQPKLANSTALDSFLSTQREIQALDSYVYPVTSKDIDKKLYEQANSFDGRTTTEDSGSGLGLDGSEIKWKEPDPRLIAKSAQEAFGWNRAKTLNKMRTTVWGGMTSRQLRREAMKRDRGEASENLKIKQFEPSRPLQLRRTPSANNPDLLDPVTPDSVNSSNLSELSPLSAVATPLGSKSYFEDITKSVSVPPNQQDAQRWAHENGLGYLLACHARRRKEEEGYVKEYRLEIDPTGWVRRANMDLVDEVETENGKPKDVSEDEAEGEAGEPKKKKEFDPPLRPVRMWISSDLLKFDSRGKQLMKELDEKGDRKKEEREEKESRKKLGLKAKDGKKSKKPKTKAQLQKGKKRNKALYGLTDDDYDDDIFGSDDDTEEEEDLDGDGDITLKPAASSTTTDKLKKNQSIRESTPPSRREVCRTSSTSVKNAASLKKTEPQSITIIDSDDEDEPNSSKSESKSSKDTASSQASTKHSSKPISSSKAPVKSASSSSTLPKSKSIPLSKPSPSIFSKDDDSDDPDESLPTAFDLIRRTNSSNPSTQKNQPKEKTQTNNRIRNRSPKETSSDAFDVGIGKSQRKSPRKSRDGSGTGKGKGKEWSQNQSVSKSDVELQDSDDSVMLISSSSSSKSAGKKENLTKNSKEEPIVLSD